MNDIFWIGFWLMSPGVIALLTWAGFEIRKNPRIAVKTIAEVLGAIAAVAAVIGVVCVVVGTWSSMIDRRCADPSFAAQDGHKDTCRTWLKENVQQ